MTKKIKLFKDFTYYSLLKEAIYSSSSRMITANDIFNYFVLRYPDLFRQSNSMTWKGNIRQVLSKNPEFIKINKKDYNRLHYWTHKPEEVLIQEENRLNKCLMDKQETLRMTTNLDRPYDYFSTIDGDRYYRKNKENKNNNIEFIKKSSIIINNKNTEDLLSISTEKNVDEELKNILDLSSDLEAYRINENLNKTDEAIFKNDNYQMNRTNNRELEKYHFTNEASSDSSEMQYKQIKAEEMENNSISRTSLDDLGEIAYFQNSWHILNIGDPSNVVYEEPVFRLPNNAETNLINSEGKQQNYNKNNINILKARRRHKASTETENITNKSNGKSEYFYDFNDEKVYIKKHPKK